MIRKKKTPLMKVNVVHSLPGRLRLRAEALRYLASIGDELLASFDNSTYIEKVIYTPVTAGLLVFYEAEALNVEEIVEIVEGKLNQFSLIALKKERDQKNTVTVNERRLQEAPVSEFVKRIFISAASLAFFGIRNMTLDTVASTVGIEQWRHNLLELPSLISLVLSRDILKSGTLSLIENKRPNADTLTSAAVLTAILTGRSLSALMTILLSDIAEFMTAYTMEKTRSAISDILNIGDDELFVVQEDGSLRLTALEQVKTGDVVSIQTGDKLSVDGLVIEGEGYIDEAAITGEFFPALKKKGQQVYAGTIVKSGQVRVKVERIGDDTTVSRIVQMVEDASSKKAQIQNYADKFSAQLIPINFFLAAIVGVYTKDLNRALSMMIIDFSCGVRLSTATALSASIHNAARNGVLIKGGNHIETLAEADSLVLDKTGTVTEGKPKIVTVNAVEGIEEKKLIRYAAAAEEDSSHPLAQAILQKNRRAGYSIPNHGIINVEVGKGVWTTVDDETVYVGNKKFMKELDIDISHVQDDVGSMQKRGEIVIYVGIDQQCIGVLGLHDSLKGNMKKALNRLRNMGYDDIRLLTGDMTFQAEQVATRMHMDDFEAEMMPEDKAHTVLSMQSTGAKVVMIGDGINDAPALAYADIGIAIGNTRTDVAIESANITITNDDPLLIPSTVKLSRNTMRTIKENFVLVIGINTLGIVFSALGLLPVIWGSVLHNSSTIFVVLNSGRLLLNDFERRTFK